MNFINEKRNERCKLTRKKFSALEVKKALWHICFNILIRYIIAETIKQYEWTYKTRVGILQSQLPSNPVVADSKNAATNKQSSSPIIIISDRQADIKRKYGSVIKTNVKLWKTWTMFGIFNRSSKRAFL